MLELIAFGTIGFWSIVAFELCLLFWFSDTESGGWAVLSLLAFGTLMYFGNGVNPVYYAIAHPFATLAGAVGYLLMGVGWSLFKWRLLVVSQLQKYQELFQNFLRTRNLPLDTKTIPPEFKDAWLGFVRTNSNYRESSSLFRPPQAKEYKSKIVSWMSLWVFSMLLYVCRDWVVHLFSTIFTHLAGVFQRMSNDIWKRAGVEVQE